LNFKLNNNNNTGGRPPIAWLIDDSGWGVCGVRWSEGADLRLHPKTTSATGRQRVPLRTYFIMSSYNVEAARMTTGADSLPRRMRVTCQCHQRTGRAIAVKWGGASTTGPSPSPAAGAQNFTWIQLERKPLGPLGGAAAGA
jgi:hypothetical protein